MKEIKVSSEFKAQATKAILSINFFILIYLLMLVLAVGLTVLCVFGGVMLIALRPMIVTIVLGIGLASLGFLVLVFLLKFIFKSHKIDRSNLIEISREDEPKLFAMIDEIVKEVATQFPKKVYLTSDVNASVSYDSSFWSMFFPVKKNLIIGLGLVNTVSHSEFKAILSHEFGHFSQKTMKVGSYVYNVNQIIFNLLFDNASYDKFIHKWANASGYFSFFVIVAIRIIEGVKWVSKQIYNVVNKNYLALSREMEFHADEIAANVTGYEPLKTSLLRTSLADFSFNSVLSFYEHKIRDNQKSENIYRDHLFVLNFMAKENTIEVQNNLPQVSGQELSKFNKSKLVVKDQWASHPSTEDRIAMMEKTGLSSTSIDNSLANEIFTDIERTQKELTRMIFMNVVYSGECSMLSFEIFQSTFKDEFEKNAFPKIYNNYYDTKNPLFFDIQSVEQSTEGIEFEDLFSESKVEMVYTSLSLQNDIQTILQISTKNFDIKTFDYDGVKYSKKGCKQLLLKLEKEFEHLNEKIRLNDISIFSYFRAQERKTSGVSTLENLYNDFFSYDQNFDSNYAIYTKLSEELQFVQHTTTFEQIKANFFSIEPLEERLKNAIRMLLETQDYQAEITKEMNDNFELYLTKKWQYFGNEKYFDNNLEILFLAMNDFAFLLSRIYFLIKQKLLNYQVELLQHTN